MEWRKKIKATVREALTNLYGEMSDLKMVQDPKVPTTFAFRATFKDNEPLDFLLVTGRAEEVTVDFVEENIDECEFEAWPPVSGSLKLF